MDTVSRLGTSLSEIADHVAEYAAPIADEAMVPATAIGFITKNGLVEERYHGVNHAAGPLSSRTVFSIGSSTKAMLGATQAVLIDRGELDWNDRVIDHYPAFEMRDPWVTREFRIADLLAQRSGLSEYAAELPYEMGHPWETGIAALKYLDPISSFRSEFCYQNMFHYIAGEIIAEKTGAGTWGEAAQALLFDPLRMRSTGTSRETLEAAPDTTRGYDVRDGAMRERPLEDFPMIAEGAGSVLSNLEDMAQWVAMHLSSGQAPGGRFISPERLEETYLSRIAVTGRFSELIQHGTARPDVGYATGWFVHSLPEGRIIEHGGNTEGYNSAVRFDPDRGIGVVVLTNQGDSGGIAGHIGKYAMDLIQGRDPLDYYVRDRQRQADAEAPANAAQAKAAQSNTTHGESVDEAHPLAWYEGTFTHPLLGSITMQANGDTLEARLDPRGIAASAKRKTGNIFQLAWSKEDDPALEKHEVDFTFAHGLAGTAADATHLSFVLKGFTFTRTR